MARKPVVCRLGFHSYVQAHPRDERQQGPDHDRVFECAVFHRGVELARGTGKNKKDAEAMAAAKALEKLKGAAGDAESASEEAGAEAE